MDENMKNYERTLKGRMEDPDPNPGSKPSGLLKKLAVGVVAVTLTGLLAVGYLTKTERPDLDVRVLHGVLDYPIETVVTRDNKTSDLHLSYTWQIADQGKYDNTVRTEERAQTIVHDIVYTMTFREVTKYTLEEIQTTKRAKIREDMIESGNELIEKYGLEIVNLDFIDGICKWELKKPVRYNMKKKEAQNELGDAISKALQELLTEQYTREELRLYLREQMKEYGIEIFDIQVVVES